MVHRVLIPEPRGLRHKYGKFEPSQLELLFSKTQSQKLKKLLIKYSFQLYTRKPIFSQAVAVPAFNPSTQVADGSL